MVEYTQPVPTQQIPNNGPPPPVPYFEIFEKFFLEGPYNGTVRADLFCWGYLMFLLEVSVGCLFLGLIWCAGR